MNGKTISDVNPNVLKPTRKEMIEHEKMRSQYVNNSPAAFKCSIGSSSAPVNRLVDAQSAISFLQEQHAEILKGLHQQVEDLQKQCKGLQFSLTMQLPYLSDEDKIRITTLEKSLHDKEKECKELREEMLKNQQKINKLKKELHVKDQIEKQLKKELERHKELTRTNYKPRNDKERPTSVEKLRNHDRIDQPVPPPKDGRLKASVRPAALYRRLLGFGIRSLKDSSSPPRVDSPPEIDLNSSIQSTTSSIPQLPRLVGSNSSPLRQRPLIRQQLRVSSLESGEKQTLSIDQSPLTNSFRSTADQKR
uniref:CCDC92/74 N-terminal domain-containing protein n=1 Tax=Strigamia maritima TaxID=126957 RepID=T1J6I6_STRMM